MPSLARRSCLSALALVLWACGSTEGQSGTDALDVDTKPSASSSLPSPPSGADDANEETLAEADDSSTIDATGEEPADANTQDDITGDLDAEPGTSDTGSADASATEANSESDTSEATDSDATADPPTDAPDVTTDEETDIEPPQGPLELTSGNTLHLMLEVTPTADANSGMTIADRWLINLDLVIDGQSALGWFARTGEVRGESTTRNTEGSAQGEGCAAQIVGTTVVFEPCTVLIQTSVAFDTLTLDFGSGTVVGSAEGIWQIIGGDFIDTIPFVASVVGQPDLEAPSAGLAVASPVLPFDPIAIGLSEPVLEDDVRLRVTTGDGPALDPIISPRFDFRAGFVTGFTLRMQGGWPPGQSVELELEHATDAANNESMGLNLGTLQIEATQDSSSNLGFESGAEGWLKVIASSQLELNDSQDPSAIVDPVLPPEGDGMALITQRATGYLLPPQDATQLCLSAGLHAERLDAVVTVMGGFDLELSSPAEITVHSILASSFEPFADSATGWSGFMDQCVPLPPDASEGVWLNITPTGFAPPLTLPPDVLLDALRFE